MTNRRSTKRAFLTSFAAIILCFAMLTGTTFAWFTDSVTSENNVIKAGNLDIVLEYWNGTEWKDVKDASDILDGDLWEPGYVDVAYLRFKNAGSLALKYQLGVNIVSETTGKTTAGETITLSDFIYFDVIEGVNGEENAYKTRELAMAAAQNPELISAGYNVTGTLTKDSGFNYLAMVVFMPTSVDNAANHNGVDVPSIDLGINIFATQYTSEKDSFDELYDKDAAVFSVADANLMLAENKDVTLVNCTEPTEVLLVPSTYTGTLTLNNVKIAGIQEVAVSTFSLAAEEETTDGYDIVILGNVVVKATEANTSAISGTVLNISGTGHLTAIANGDHAYAIGGASTESITIKNITIDYAEGGHAYGVGSDTKYYKDAPEGGAAIGSGLNGAVITLDNVTVTKAIGGSKTAGIGASYHTGVTINIKNSIIAHVEGGVSAAGIGSSRVSNGAAENGTTINISNSTITAYGGAYGAGIGSGYDTHCQKVQPLCTINIADSTINAVGGKYAAGVGTGYHTAALAGSIANTTVNAKSGEKWYKDAYSLAMDVGFGVVDPTREGVQTDSYIDYNGTRITLENAFTTNVETVEELKTAIANGKNVVLTNDVIITDALTFGEGAKVDIDLNGQTLTVSNFEAQAGADVTVKGGTFVNGVATYPAISVVDGGKLTLIDVKVVSENYCNIVTSGSATAAEFVGVEVFGGECVLNNCDIYVEATELRYSNSVFGVGIHDGSLVMNGGSITVKSVGSTKEKYDYQSAIFTGGGTEKSITLNNVEINAEKLLYAWGGNTTVNTTDAEGSWTADKIDARNGGTYVINYVN